MSTGPGRRVQVEGDMFHGRIPAGAIYVGRQMPGIPASRYNNPHTMPTKKQPGCRACGEAHDREDLVYAYRHHLDDHPELVEMARVELAGRDLACWCKPPNECHVDVLLEVVGGAPPLDLGPLIEPCRLCAEQGRTFDGEGLPIFKRILPGGLQSCILCDGTTMPDYRLV